MSRKQILKIIPFSKEFCTQYHKWEVFIPLEDGRMRITTWEKENPEGFVTPEDQYASMIDFVNGCRDTDTPYYVFMDDELTDL